MANVVRSGLWLAVLTGAMLAMQGCREEEQDRVLLFEPGVYKGQKEPGLSEQQVQDLRHRARSQQF